MIQDMSTTYGYTKQVESHQQGSKHTRAISPKKGTYVRRLTKPASLVHEHMFIGHRTYVHRPSNICSPKSPLFGSLDVGRNHVIVELNDRSEMNTEHGYRKQVESHHQGSKHTLASLMSKLRSSLGAAWEQLGSSLEYAYSMLMTTFLRPFSSKRAELERRLASDEITARPSRDYGSSVTILRLVMSLLLLLIVGTGNVWGQDYSGTYYIKSASTCKSPSGDYYLCPTEEWAFFHAKDNVNSTDNGQPFLTTHIMDSGDEAKYVWIVEKHTKGDHDYYAFKHNIKNEGVSRYLSYNRQLNGAGVDRLRIHLKKTETPGDYELFDITPKSTNLVIMPKIGDEDDNNTRKYLVVNGGNTNYFQAYYVNAGGVKKKENGPSGFTLTTGIIGTYSALNDDNNPFNLVIPTPTFSLNSGNKVEIAEMESVEVYYTTDGSVPVVPAAGQEPTEPTKKYTAAIPLNANNQLKIKAIATNKDHSITSSIVTYVYTCDITLENTSFEYNGTEIKPTISSVKIGEEEVPSDWYDVKCTNNVNVGPATLTLSGKAGGDYVVQGSTTFSIIPLIATLNWNGTELPYNKTVQKPTATVGNLKGDDVCEVTVSITEGDGVEVGDYTATATALSNPNYQLPGEATTTFHIVHIALSVTAVAAEKVYGDADPEFTYTDVTGLLEGDALTGALSRENVESQNVGEYAITVGTLSAGSNYTITLNDVKLKITPAPLTVTADDREKDWTDPTTPDPVLTFSLGDGELKYSDTKEMALTGALVREEGEDSKSYKILQGTLAPSENYTITAFTEGTFTIHGTSINPTVTLNDWTYGSPNNPSVTGNTGKAAVTYTYKKSNEGDDKYTGTKPVNYGNYNVRAQIAAKGAYEAATVTSLFTINKAPLTINVQAQTKDYLDVDPEFTYDVVGLKYTDVEKNVITCVLGRGSGETVGTYNITKTSHTIKSSNYSLGSFVGNTLTINKKNIGNGGNPESGITISAYQSGETWAVSMYNGKNAFLTTDFTYAVSEADTDGNRTITVTASGDNCTGSTIITYSNYTFPIVVGTDEKACPYYIADNDFRSSPDVVPYIVNKVNPSLGMISISPISYIPKDVPVLLLAKNEVTGLSLSPKIDNETIPKNTIESNRLLYSSEGAVPVADAEAYLFYNGEFVLTKAGSIKQDRFYIYNPNYAGETEDTSSDPAPSRELRIISGNMNTTGVLMLIDNAQPKTSEDRWYTVDGRQLTGMPIKKGLYINKGRKVVIK